MWALLIIGFTSLMYSTSLVYYLSCLPLPCMCVNVGCYFKFQRFIGYKRTSINEWEGTNGYTFFNLVNGSYTLLQQFTEYVIFYPINISTLGMAFSVANSSGSCSILIGNHCIVSPTLNVNLTLFVIHCNLFWWIIDIQCRNYFHQVTFHPNFNTSEGRGLANGWTHPSSLIVFVNLFIKTDIQKITIVT